MLFFDTINGTNSFRNLTMIEVIEPSPVALSKLEWNAVRRCAEQRSRHDHGLALALATLFRYAGPRVSEVAVLQIPDVQVSARRGLLIIQRSNGNQVSYGSMNTTDNSPYYRYIRDNIVQG